jgi:hypothetical protein
MAMRNVLLHIPDYLECLNLMERALANPDPQVRTLAAHSLLRQSRVLQSGDVEKLEASLRKKPDDLALRVLLLAFYFIRCAEGRYKRDERYRHITWIIENRPESEIAGSPLAQVNAAADNVAWEKARTLWLKQVDTLDANKLLGSLVKLRLTQNVANAPISSLEDGGAEGIEGAYLPSAAPANGPENPAARLGGANPSSEYEGRDSTKTAKSERARRILLNAAQFFAQTDPALTEALLRTAHELEPSLESCFQLIRLYASNIPHSSYDISATNDRLSTIDSLLDTLPDPRIRAGLLPLMARAAFAAGCSQRAQAYASEVVTMAPQVSSDLVDERHQAHLVLGRIAFRAGHRQLAISHLLDAAQATPTPVLSSFGPGMTLAKELLEAGEQDAVIQYLERCHKFWTPANHDLDVWIQEIKQGKIPDLGTNLSW